MTSVLKILSSVSFLTCGTAAPAGSGAFDDFDGACFIVPAVGGIICRRREEEVACIALEAAQENGRFAEGEGERGLFGIE